MKELEEIKNIFLRKEFIFSLFILIFCIYFFSYRRIYKKQTLKESKKAAKIDMRDWPKWFRELPAKYSPAIVSFLCNYQEELHKDLSGVVLFLCVNKYIDIIDNGHEIIFQDKSKDTSDLMYHEKYVLYYILNKIDKFDAKKFKEYIIHDAKKLDLVVDKIDKNNFNYKDREAMEIWRGAFKTSEKFIIFLFCIIGFSIGFFNTFPTLNELTILSRLIFSAIAGIFGILVFMLLYVIVGKNLLLLFLIRFTAKTKAKSEFDYLRTKKGDLDYKNWISFKQFLEDFSLINTRDLKEVYLWEYYLAYATSLGVADKVLKTSDSRIMNNNKFKILNYNKFIANIDKSKNNF